MRLSNKQKAELKSLFLKKSGDLSQRGENLKKALITLLEKGQGLTTKAQKHNRAVWRITLITEEIQGFCALFGYELEYYNTAPRYGASGESMRKVGKLVNKGRIERIITQVSNTTN